MKIFWPSFLSLGFLVFICSCTSNDMVSTDNYSRSTLLDTWANQLILPSYEAYLTDLRALKVRMSDYVNNLEDLAKLEEVKEQLFQTRLAWQNVDMFEMGPAEAVNLRLRSNTYPVDMEGVIEHISTGIYDLDLPSSISRQGFPTMEYLLYTNEPGLDQAKLAEYLLDITETLLLLSERVVDEWKAGYASEFVSNDGTSATSSFNSYMNDYLLYYERFLRAGKVGIPAGVFSGTALTSHVESRYDRAKDLSYLKQALKAFESFYRGTYNGLPVGPSIRDYLDYLADLRNDQTLSVEIDSRFLSIKQKYEAINEDFAIQIEQDNIKFLELYDELQALVVLIKVDAFSTLNVKVDFVDADGD